MSATSLEPAQRRAARLAGALYISQMATGVFGFVVRSPLIARGDAARTAENIVAAERWFRLSIVTDVAVAAQVIALVWALYVLLRPVNRDLVLLGAFFRVAENAVLCAVTVNLLLALTLAKGTDYLKPVDAVQLHALARLFIGADALGYSLAFILLGIGSAIISYVLWQSRYAPRALAALGVCASAWFSVASGASIVFPGATQLLQMTSWAPMGLFEVGLGAWLLIRGARITP